MTLLICWELEDIILCSKTGLGVENILLLLSKEFRLQKEMLMSHYKL
jgi:hypothetical protein